MKNNLKTQNFKYIDIKKIDINPNQPRKVFNDDSITELSKTIESVGLLQPIIVEQRGDRYLIIAGERRFRASVKAKKESIPCIVRKLEAKERREIEIIENLQREDLNILDEAMAIERLIKEYKMTQEEAATSLGKSRSSIANILRILKLEPEILMMVRENKITYGHARALVSIKDKNKQFEYARAVSESGISVNDLEKMISSINKKPTKKKKKDILTDLVYIQDMIQEIYMTRIEIKGDKRRGKIQIDYYSTEDLARILKLLIKKDL